MDKHYGFYRGKVTNNQDPENRMRVKLLVPQILGAEETEWAWGCVPLNWSGKDPVNGAVFVKTPSHSNHVFTDHNDGEFSSGNSTTTLVHDHNHDKFVLQDVVPKIGTGVWVTFEGGDINHPIWMGVWA